jgi:hypothetical protein
MNYVNLKKQCGAIPQIFSIQYSIEIRGAVVSRIKDYGIS